MGFLDFYAGDGSADSGYDGFYWKKISEKPPKEINAIYGYRTAMSMKNKKRPGNTRIAAVGSSGVSVGFM